MTQRKRNPYARTYLFQTDGSAALKAREVMDVSNPKGKEQDTIPKKRPFALFAPVWGILLYAAAAVFLLAILLLNMSSAASQIQKDIVSLRQAERQAKEIMDSLEVQIAQAEAPEKIHSVAVNRLGMYRPTEEEIVFIPFVDDLAHMEGERTLPDAQRSIMQYLFSLLGF